MSSSNRADPDGGFEPPQWLRERGPERRTPPKRLPPVAHLAPREEAPFSIREDAPLSWSEPESNASLKYQMLRTLEPDLVPEPPDGPFALGRFLPRRVGRVLVLLGLATTGALAAIEFWPPFFAATPYAANEMQAAASRPPSPAVAPPGDYFASRAAEGPKAPEASAPSRIKTASASETAVPSETGPAAARALSARSEPAATNERPVSSRPEAGQGVPEWPAPASAASNAPAWPTDPTPAAPQVADPAPEKKPEAKVAALPPSAPSAREILSAGEIDALVRRGMVFMKQGDVSAARGLLGRAAEAHSAEAAFALATTYDPDELKRLGVLGLAPDLEQARAWYRKAAEYGSPEAARRLELLSRR